MEGFILFQQNMFYITLCNSFGYCNRHSLEKKKHSRDPPNILNSSSSCRDTVQTRRPSFPGPKSCFSASTVAPCGQGHNLKLGGTVTQVLNPALYPFWSYRRPGDMGTFRRLLNRMHLKRSTKHNGNSRKISNDVLTMHQVKPVVLNCGNNSSEQYKMGLV